MMYALNHICNHCLGRPLMERLQLPLMVPGWTWPPMVSGEVDMRRHFSTSGCSTPMHSQTASPLLLAIKSMKTSKNGPTTSG